MKVLLRRNNTQRQTKKSLKSHLPHLYFTARLRPRQPCPIAIRGKTDVKYDWLHVTSYYCYPPLYLFATFLRGTFLFFNAASVRGVTDI
uniref:Uncharacterized protein n=1 Tax=Romanomermis culicivorax TaxID=13658 RepID=A0A915HFK7_ROMCU